MADAQPYELEPPVLYNTCFDECRLERLIAGLNPQQQREQLREQQVEFVVVRWSELERYRDTYGYSDFVTRQRLAELVRDGVLQPLDWEFDPQVIELYRALPP